MVTTPKFGCNLARKHLNLIAIPIRDKKLGFQHSKKLFMCNFSARLRLGSSLRSLKKIAIRGQDQNFNAIRVTQKNFSAIWVQNIKLKSFR